MLTPEQMEIRRTRIGSSDIGAIVGVDPHRTAMGVFNDKTFPKDEPSEEMRWGSFAEANIGKWHAAQEGFTFLPGETIGSLIAGEFACASPDFYMAPVIAAGGKVKLVETKNVGWYNEQEWGKEGDDAPFKYLAQVHWQLGVCRAAERRFEIEEEAHLVPSIGNTPPRLYVVKFDPELFGILLDKAERFVRDHLRTGKPPAFDGSGAGDEYLRRRYSVQREELLPPTEEAITIHRALLTMEATCEAANQEKQMLAQQLKAAIGESAGMVGIGTWKKARDGSRRFLPVRPKKGTNGAGVTP